MITDIVEVAGVLVSFLLVNRIGRRPLLLWTSCAMAVVLLICGGLGTIPEAQRTDGVNKAIAAMIIIYVLYVFSHLYFSTQTDGRVVYSILRGDHWHG